MKLESQIASILLTLVFLHHAAAIDPVCEWIIACLVSNLSPLLPTSLSTAVLPGEHLRDSLKKVDHLCPKDKCVIN